MATFGPSPGVPLLIKFTPATFPCMAAIGEEAGVESNASPLTTVIGEVKSLALAEP